MSRSLLFFGLWIPALILCLAAIQAVFAAPPAQIEAGAMAQKIFYFHVSSAWTAFMAFLIAAGFGLGHLIAESSSQSASRRAAACFSAIEVGFLFCTVVLITGPIWARPVWGVWWRWEPRLTTFLILWATYASCLVVRASIDRAPFRDRAVSVYAIVAAVQIPVVYVSVHFWKPEAQFHPPTIALAPEFLYPLWMSMAAMTALFFLLWRFRTHLCLLEERTMSHG
ncbi:cytochrome c biogenesis protein CcsA [bacterium]|nr:cytochrome c biogenesis protein CcsA [bacterium]